MRRHTWIAMILVMGLVLTACGGDETGEGTTTTGAETTTAATETTEGADETTAPSETTAAAETSAPEETSAAGGDAVNLTLLSNAIVGGKNDIEATWIEEYVIPEFEARMEEAGTPVSVEFTGRGVDDEDYKAQLSLDLGAGAGADVFAIDGIWVGEFANGDFIAPLEETIGPDVAEWEGWEQIPDAVEANMSFEGSRYGVPSGTDGRVIFYNKEIFAEAGLPEDWVPATWDEVMEAAQTIKESLPDVTPIQLNAGVAMGEATTMQGALPLLAAAGAPIYDEEAGLWTGATPEMTTMLESYATIYGEDALGNPDLQLRQDGRDRSFFEFSEGGIAMLLEGDYFWRSVVNPVDGIAPMENRDEVVGYTKIPAYEPGEALGGFDAASMSGGGGYVINPNSDNPEMAWELLKFMNQPESIIELVGPQVRITQRDDVNAEILSEDPMLFYVAEEVLPVTHYRPGFAEYPEVSVALQEATEAVVTGTSAADAAAQYQAALEGIVGADAVDGG